MLRRKITTCVNTVRERNTYCRKLTLTDHDKNIENI